MKEAAIIRHCLDRLCDNQGQNVLLTADEVGKWPPKSLNALIQVGFIKSASAATDVECEGCEEYCVMPVTVMQGSAHKAEAFISCDKRDDVGIIPIQSHRLKRWQLSMQTLASALTNLLKLDVVKIEPLKNNRFALGLLKGDRCRRSVLLVLGESILLEVNGYQEPLADLLYLQENRIILSRENILRWVNKPTRQVAAKSDSSPPFRREARKTSTQDKHQGWIKQAKALKKKSSSMSNSACAEHIERNLPKDKRGKRGYSRETILRKIQNI